MGVPSIFNLLRSSHRLIGATNSAIDVKSVQRRKASGNAPTRTSKQKDEVVSHKAKEGETEKPTLFGGFGVPVNIAFPNPKGVEGREDREEDVKEVIKDGPTILYKELKKLGKEVSSIKGSVEKTEILETLGGLKDDEARAKFRFRTSEELSLWHTGCDSDWKEGFSSVRFEPTDRGTAVFSGSLSSAVMKDGRTERAGWAANMGNKMLPYLFLLFSLFSSSSASCGLRPPSDGDYVVLAAGIDHGPLTTVLNEARDEGVVGLAIDSPKDQCDTSCLFTLEYYNAPHNHSSLVVRKELGELVPIGYTRNTNRSTVYCARTNGGCGATVPVWRHFYMNATGIYHTYSLDDSMMNGYTREGLPLCYVWSQDVVEQEGSGIESLLSGDDRNKRNTVVARDASNKTCEGYLPNKTKMEMLSEHKNNRTGSEHDTYYTLKTSKDLNGYNKTKDLGLIMTSKDASCSCLVTLVQTFDNQTGIFHRIDHKLMREDAELNRIFEKYNVTGEKLYCAAQKGLCGASIPLYKHFDFINMDSIITTSDKDIPAHSYRYPSEPLCWIWSVSYDPIGEGEGVTGRGKRSTQWEEEEWSTNGWRNTTKWMNTTTTTVRVTTSTPTITSNGSTSTTRINSTASFASSTRLNSTTVRITSITPNSTVHPPSTITPSTPRITNSTIFTPSSNSTIRSTLIPTTPSLALDEIIIRMVRSALGNDTNWRNAVRTKLRDISERI